MDEIESVCANSDWHSVEPIEERFISDNGAIPSIVEFNSSIDSSKTETSEPIRDCWVGHSPNIEENSVDDESENHDFCITVNQSSARGIQKGILTLLGVNLAHGLIEVDSDERLDRKTNVDREGDDLQYDTPQHDSSTSLGISSSFCRRGGFCSTDGLDDQGSNIKRNKDDKIYFKKC